MRKIVVIDAGHGGPDPGAVGKNGLKEKDVALVVTLLVQYLLAPYVDVLLTRTKDTAVVPGGTTAAELSGRANFANRAGADIFVSIHLNGVLDPTANGLETLCYKFGFEGEKLARNLQKSVQQATGLRDRDVKAGNLAVLRETKMPAALVELGFISNPNEEKLLASSQFHDVSAQAIASGILGYLQISHSIGAPPKTTPPLPYSDIEGNPAINDILLMHQLGLMVGGTDGKFYPKGTVQRDQQAAIQARLLRLLRDAKVPGIEELFKSLGR